MRAGSPPCWMQRAILSSRGDFRGRALKPIRILISGVIGNRLIPARDFFLEKKQKRARCSGLPSRFILCRTCRAKPPVWAAFPFASPMRRARHARTRLWPCACAQGAAPRGAVMRSGRQMRWLEGVRWRKRRPACEDGGRYAAVVSAGVVAQSACLRKCQRFWGCGDCGGHLTPSEFEFPIISEIASSRRGTSF